MTQVVEQSPIARVMIVEDNDAQRQVLFDMMLEEGFEPIACSNGAEALRHIRDETFALAIIDHRLPDINGIQLLERLQGFNTQLRAIIHTGYGSFESARDAVNLGAFAYVEKLGNPEDLVRHVHRAFQDWMAEALKKSEERFAKVFHASPIAIAITTVDEGRCIDVNESFLRIFGYAREDVISRTALELGLWPHETARQDVLREVVQRGAVHDLELTFLTRTGEQRHLQGAVEQFHLHDQASLLWIGIDVTKRKQAEQALRESEERYRLLAEQMVDLVCLHAPDGQYLYVSPSSQRLLDYAPEELLGRDPYDLFHWEDRARIRATAHEKVLRGEANVRIAYRLRRKTGEYLWFETDSMPLLNEDGEVVQIVTSSRDITERKRAEEAIRISEARLREAQHMAHVGSWEWDLVTDKITWSDEMYRIHGIAGKAFHDDVQTAITTAVHPDDQERVRHVLQAAVRECGRAEQEYRIVLPDGAERVVFGQGEVICGEGGAAVRMVGTVQDITERRRLEKEILEISGREQRRIGQDLHDELGQLLTGIGFRVAELEGDLRQGAPASAQDAAEIGQMVERAISQTRALARGLNPFSVGQQGLLSALRDLTLRVEEVYGIACTLTCLQPARIEDQEVAMQVYRIAQESINNAVKHAHATCIEVILTQEDALVTLTIQDDGVGIPPPGRRRPGMGLRIMEYRAHMIGGTVEALPRPQRGTLVTCRFTLTPPSPSP